MSSKPKKNDYWQTPQDFFARCHEEFRFTVDAAATPENALLPRYWSEEDDALEQDWGGERVWLNCPYSLPLQELFLAKCHAERDRAQVIVALIPASPDTRHWHDYAMVASEIRLIRGRLYFYDSLGVQRTQPRHRNALVVWRPGCYGASLSTMLARIPSVTQA